MHINSTLLIQAFNFFIAYTVLRSLLFRPAMNIVEDEKQAQLAARYAVEEHRTMIAERERKKEQQRRGYQQELSAHIPDDESSWRSGIYQAKEICKERVQFSAFFVDEVANALVQRMQRVRQ